MRWIVGATVVVALGIAAPAVLRASDRSPAQACVPTDANPIAICFAATPVVLDRCLVKLRPAFDIQVLQPPVGPGTRYRFTIELLKDGKGVAEGFKTFAGETGTQFPFTEQPDLGQIEWPYSGRGNYAVRVSVESNAKTSGSETSQPTHIEDRPRIAGVSIGVSNYDNDSYNLKFADDDARAFKRAIEGIFRGAADVAIELKVSTDATGITAKDLLDTIRNAGAGADPDNTDRCAAWLSGPNDWYVFYYSGHGIVQALPNKTRPGTREPVVQRALSTRFFDPRKASTAMRVTDLQAALLNTRGANVLIVIDSCFSGQRRSLPNSPSLVDTSKALLFSASTRSMVPLGGSGDSDVFPQVFQSLSNSARQGLLFAAADEDQVAEEAVVWYDRARGQSLLEVNRSRPAAPSTADPLSAGRSGYGVFTFAWLSNLIAQVPSDRPIDIALPGGLPPNGQKGPGCAIDFERAYNRAKTDFDALEERGVSDQKPNFLFTKHRPAALECVP